MASVTSMVARDPRSARAAGRVSYGKSGGVSGGVSGGGEVGAGGGREVGEISRRVYRPEDVRARFTRQWSAWCRANFRNSVQLAAAFGVSEKTARLWLEEVNAPQGYAVACASEGLVAGAAPFRLDRAA